jgi:hypothetical protein
VPGTGRWTVSSVRGFPTVRRRQGQADGRVRMNGRGVEQRNVQVPLLEQQPDLRAAGNDPLCTPVREFPDDLQVRVAEPSRTTPWQSSS